MKVFLKNPFNFGAVATGKLFIDRLEELERLRHEMESASKVLLISPRRFGKTSLAFKLKEELSKDKNFIVIYLDTLTCVSTEQFVNKYALVLTKALETALDKIVSALKEFVPTLRPQIQISSEGELSLQIANQSSPKDLEDVFEKILDLPEQAAKKRKKKIVVILDEFQAIREFQKDAPNALLWKMRSKIQHHKNVGYIFAGSQKHILEQMALPKDAPFYKMLNIMRLNKIDEQIFLQFIKKMFAMAQIKTNSEALQLIIARTENIPYYVINLCHELVEYCYHNKKPLNKNVVDEVIPLLVRKNFPQYESEWERLTVLQKNVLRAVAAGRRQLLSLSTLKEFSLGSVGGAQAALKVLISSQHLIRTEDGVYGFEDLWFKEWIKLKINPGS